MQPGRLSQAIWKKNIVHPLERANVCISEGTLSGVTRPTPFISDVTQVCLVGRSPATVMYGICRGINELAVFGTRAAGVDLHVELPEETEEDWIRQMTEALIGILQEQNLWIRNLDVRVNPTVKLPLFALSVMGVEKEENGRSETSDIKKQIESGVDYEILMVPVRERKEYSRILEEREEESSKRLSLPFKTDQSIKTRTLCDGTD